MAKDRVKPLFGILATGDSARIRTEATKALNEIQEEIADLNRDSKLIKDIIGRYGGAPDGMTPQDRSAKVREAATAMARDGRLVISPQDVLDYLKDREAIEFAVSKPASMVATILAQSDDFERTALNQFEFKGGIKHSDEAN